MLKRVPTQVVDVVLALVFMAVNTWELLTPTSDGFKTGSLAGNLVVLNLFAALLVLRRRSPLLCWVLMHAEFLLSALVVPHGGFAWGTSLPSCIVTYTVARYDGRGRSRLALLAGPFVWAGILISGVSVTKLSAAVGFFVASTVIAWGLGRLLRRLAERDAELQDARDRLQAEQVRAEEAAVREERARIALEMHDVVAVAVDTMVTRLREETRLLTADGDDVGSLATAEEAGRQALLDLRRTMGVLRPADQALDRVPSLADADELVAGYREAGLAVDWRADPVDGVPQGVSFAAYRILQEALTNALKHGAGPVEAGVDVDECGLVVRVHNRLAPTPVAQPSGRHGLVGMRERVAAFGGSLHAGLDDDRFEVRATLPTRVEVPV